MSERLTENTQNTPDQNSGSQSRSIESVFDHNASNANIDYLNDVLHGILLEQVDVIVNEIIKSTLEKGVTLSNKDIEKIKNKTEKIIRRIYVDMPIFYDDVVKSTRVEWDSRKPIRTLLSMNNSIVAKNDRHKLLSEHINSEYKLYILNKLKKLHLEHFGKELYEKDPESGKNFTTVIGLKLIEGLTDNLLNRDASQNNPFGQTIDELLTQIDLEFENDIVLSTKNNFQTLFQTFFISATLSSFFLGLNEFISSSDLLRLSGFQDSLAFLITGGTLYGYALYINKLKLFDETLRSPDQRLDLEKKLISPKSFKYISESTKKPEEIMILRYSSLISEALYATLLLLILTTSAFAGYNAITDRESDNESSSNTNGSIEYDQNSNFTDVLYSLDFTPRVLVDTTFPDGSFLVNRIFAGNQPINIEPVVPKDISTLENINSTTFTYRSRGEIQYSILPFQPKYGQLVRATINGELIETFIDPNTGVYYMLNPEEDGEITSYWDGTEQRIHLPENANIQLSDEQDAYIENVLEMLGISVEDNQESNEIGDAMRDGLYSLDFRSPSGIDGAIQAVRVQVETLIAAGDTDITIEELDFYCDTMAFWMQAVGAAVGDPLGVAQGGVVRNGQILNLTLHAMNFDENGFIDYTPWRIDETSEITRQYLEALANADEKEQQNILEKIIAMFENLPGSDELVKFLMIMGVPGLLGLFAMYKYNNPKGDGVEFIVDDSLEFFERGKTPEDPEPKKKYTDPSKSKSVQSKVQLGNIKIDKNLIAFVRREYSIYRNPNQRGRRLNRKEVEVGIQTIVDSSINSGNSFEDFRDSLIEDYPNLDWEGLAGFYAKRKVELVQRENIYMES